jgi:hypothetical protein
VGFRHRTGREGGRERPVPELQQPHIVLTYKYAIETESEFDIDTTAHIFFQEWQGSWDRACVRVHM